MNVQMAEKKYKALANKRRLAILQFLSSCKQATVGDISEKIRLSFKATSKHLQILKNAGFIDSEQVSLEQRYFLIDRSDIFTRQVLSIL